LVGPQARCVARNVGEEKLTGVRIGDQQTPGHAAAHRVLGPTGHQAKPGQARAEVLADKYRVRVIGAELVEPRHAAIVLARMAKPETLSAEQVDAVGAVHLVAVGGRQRAGLIPYAAAKTTGLFLRSDFPGTTQLPDVKVMAVELWPPQPGLLAPGLAAVLGAVRKVEGLVGSESRRDSCGRVVISRHLANERGVLEDRRVNQAGDRGDIAADVTGRRWTAHVIEVEGRHRLAHADDQLVVEEHLTPPQLIEFLANERRCRLQTVVGLDDSGLLIGWLAAELEELDAQHAALDPTDLVGVYREIEKGQTVGAPLSRLQAPGHQPVDVAEPGPAQVDARVLLETQEPAEGACAGHDIVRG